YSFTKPYSEKTAEEIDLEVKKIIKIQFDRAKKILTENKEGLIKLAENLLAKEVIYSDDLEEIFGKSKYDTYNEEQKETEQKNNTNNKTKSETPEAINNSQTKKEKSTNTDINEKNSNIT
ncbi:MAG: cell division protein FtsH, partial [Bacteroidetes bacterium]